MVSYNVLVCTIKFSCHTIHTITLLCAQPAMYDLSASGAVHLSVNKAAQHANGEEHDRAQQTQYSPMRRSREMAAFLEAYHRRMRRRKRTGDQMARFSVLVMVYSLDVARRNGCYGLVIFRGLRSWEWRREMSQGCSFVVWSKSWRIVG